MLVSVYNFRFAGVSVIKKTNISPATGEPN